MHTYEVVFCGQIAPGADLQQVRQGIQRLFNASDALLEQFFSGRRIVVKRGLDSAAAEKYRQAFARVGALVELIVEHSEDSAPAAAAPAVQTPATRPAADAAAAAGRAQVQVVPRDEYMAAFAHVQAPDFGLAAAGADLQPERPELPVVEVDISGISLAPAGSDLEQLPGVEPVTPPDISHLSLERID